MCRREYAQEYVRRNMPGYGQEEAPTYDLDFT